jgi:preprotein translocase subunit SecF
MSRTTYSQATNLAVNQTMMRSLNTSLASLLPILGLLVVGNYLLGAETLKDLALALFVGVTAGAYSSIFIAPPLVAMWKEKEPRYAQLRARVERLAAQGPGAERERPERPVRGRRPATAQRPGAKRRPEPEPEMALEPELPPDDALEDEEPAEPVEERAVVAQAPSPRRQQPQKPRPNQQRRKPSGRQQSRPAKRRRR